MTTEHVREILKVHIKAAEQSGKLVSALSLMEILDVIDFELAEERRIGRVN